MAAKLKVESATQTSEAVSDIEYDHYMFDHTCMASPRVVVDTSSAFASVHEAILRFGGPGFWVPRPYRSSTPEVDLKEPEMYSLEDQSTAMLKDLNKKEQETLDILKELELTKRLVEELKSRLSIETPPSQWLHDGPDPESMFDKNKEYAKKKEHSAIGLIMKELKQTKLNLNQNTNELAAIRASVESLSKKIESDKGLIQKDGEMKSNSHSPMRNNIETLGVSNPINPIFVSKGLQELNYEAEQFMKTADETRLEILKAMSGIEQTKTCLRVVQMRWVAAKKLEEAAKVAESLAVAEIRAFTNGDSINLEGSHQKPPRISLSLEEYSILMDKARKSENMKEFGGSFNKIEEAMHDKLNNMTLEEVLDRVEVMNRKRVSFDDNVRTFGSDSTQRKSPAGSNPALKNHDKDSRVLNSNQVRPILRPTTSIGDILSKKLVVRDEMDMERQEDDEMIERQRMSLNHLLRQQREEAATLTRNQTRKDNGDNQQKKLFSKRKALGFVHISLPLSKSSKNRSQALN